MFKKMAIAAGLLCVSLSSFANAQADQTQQLESQLQQLNNQIDSLASRDLISSRTIQKNTRHLNFGYMHLVNSKESYFQMLPSTTFDLALLQERKTMPDNALMTGGYMEMDGQYWHAGDSLAVGVNQSDLPKTGSGIYLTTLDLDIMSTFGTWTTAMIQGESSGLGTADSTFIVRKAFVTIGNLNKEPFFMTMGKSFLPFGTFYGGGVWSVPLTRSVFRPDEVPELLFAYAKNGLNTNLAFFSNDQATQYANDYVYSFYYTHQLADQVGYTIGAGYLNDMRGLPSGLGTAYQTSGVLTQTKRVPAYDLSADLKVQGFDVNAEYLAATRQGTYNSNATNANQTVVTAGQTQGAPRAWEAGLGYNAPLFGDMMSYVASYSKTYNMAGIPMGWSGQAIPGPSAFNGIKQAWLVSANRELARNVYVGFEVQHGETYALKSGYTYTLDLSVYF